MALGMKKKSNNAPPPARNQAVQVVGRTYFIVAMTGLMAAGVLAITAIAIGEASDIIKYFGGRGAGGGGLSSHQTVLSTLISHPVRPIAFSPSVYDGRDTVHVSDYNREQTPHRGRNNE